MSPNANNSFNVASANAKLNEVIAPWVQQLNLTVTEFGDGRVKLIMPFDETLCRSGGLICGQAMMAMIDTCMVFVSYLGAGKFIDCATVSQSTTFLRPAIHADILATGHLKKSGRNLIFGDVTLTAGDSPDPVCTGSLTYAVIHKKLVS